MIVHKEQLENPADNITMYLVTYLSQGLKVKGYLFIPNSDTQLPTMIYCRGGIKQVGMVRVSKMVKLARHGWIVFAPVYRGNEAGEGKEDFAGEDRYDVIDAIPVVRSIPEAKPNKIALFGFSRGAMMAMRTAKVSDEIGSIVLWGGVSDLFLTYEERTDLRKMLKRVVGHPDKQPEVYIERSPVFWADQIEQPIYIVHGTKDEQVSVEHAHRLIEILKRQRKMVKYSLYDGLGHVFPEKEDSEALADVFEWLNLQQKMESR